MEQYDSVVIGAGHNGLVAALYLARAGWKVLVLERNDRIGGAVRSAEITRPGFVHDLYSTNQNLFRSSAVYREMKADLERHGLTYRVADKPFCNVYPDGASLRVYRDVQRTLSGLRAHQPEDADGWAELYEQFKAFRKHLLPLYAMPLPSAQAGWALVKAALAVGVTRLLNLGQLVFNSTRELGENFFASQEARALLATWGMHLDFGPDVPGGAFFPFVESFSNMEEGMSIAEGGASRMVDALAGLLREAGGEIRTQAEVSRVLAEGSRATGVELASGERIGARRAVIANLTPTVLFERLLPHHPLPRRFRQQVKRYTYGPGTMMIHLALSGKPLWAAGDEIGEFAYVHIAPTVDDLARTYTQAANGMIPESPLVIAGQTSVVDPTRAPEGQHVLWVQVRALPSMIEGDAAGEIEARNWDAAKEPVAERVLDKLERYAPGLRGLVLDRVVFSPADLERDNPNLVGGDSIAGSHHLRQNFVFRPFPGWTRYRMPLDGLIMVGAATWPGAGTNATSGYLAAQQLLHPPKRRRQLAAAGVGATLAAVAGYFAARRFERRG